MSIDIKRNLISPGLYMASLISILFTIYLLFLIIRIEVKKKISFIFRSIILLLPIAVLNSYLTVMEYIYYKDIDFHDFIIGASLIGFYLILILISLILIITDHKRLKKTLMYMDNSNLEIKIKRHSPITLYCDLKDECLISKIFYLG